MAGTQVLPTASVSGRVLQAVKQCADARKRHSPMATVREDAYCSAVDPCVAPS